MKMDKQCADSAQNGGTSGTKVTGVTPKAYTGVVSSTGVGPTPSGSTQSDKRGKQGK